MFVIIGIFVVLGAIVGGYLLEHGNLLVLLQPAELVIIGGAALGTLLIANPLPMVIRILKGILGCLKGTPYTKAFYLDTLKMFYELFTRARRQGLTALEADLETPSEARSLPTTRNSWRIIMPSNSCATLCAPMYPERPAPSNSIS